MTNVNKRAHTRAQEEFHVIPSHVLTSQDLLLLLLSFCSYKRNGRRMKNLAESLYLYMFYSMCCGKWSITTAAATTTRRTPVNGGEYLMIYSFNFSSSYFYFDILSFVRQAFGLVNTFYMWERFCSTILFICKLLEICHFNIVVEVLLLLLLLLCLFVMKFFCQVEIITRICLQCSIFKSKQCVDRTKI